jgi:hypothetical protein
MNSLYKWESQYGTALRVGAPPSLTLAHKGGGDKSASAAYRGNRST